MHALKFASTVLPAFRKAPSQHVRAMVHGCSSQCSNRAAHRPPGPIALARDFFRSSRRGGLHLWSSAPRTEIGDRPSTYIKFQEMRLLENPIAGGRGGACRSNWARAGCDGRNETEPRPSPRAAAAACSPAVPAKRGMMMPWPGGARLLTPPPLPPPLLRCCAGVHVAEKRTDGYCEACGHPSVRRHHGCCDRGFVRLGGCEVRWVLCVL
ncbi:hypothetical protein EDC01DRAFT_409810 [Geopyxis carbonaria]|nr:hypothetical protein EDC01DRAFT_409810 [Geopyxis carbonaria]